MQTLWIDAVDFENKGEWKIESQFVRDIGQSYLIATVVPGEPVKDATTSFTVNEDGMYRFYVRTKNWYHPYAPGQFKLAADGEELHNICGKMPTHTWYWEIAGDIYLKAGTHTLSAVDKTGWLARFAAVVITNDMDFFPTREKERMLKQRAAIKGIKEEIKVHDEFEFVVMGAGPGGVPAAVAAARNGIKTALISGRPVIGGNASSEGNVGFDGAAVANKGFWEGGIANEVRQLRWQKNIRWQECLEEIAGKEENLTVFVNELCIDAESEDGKIVSATTVNTMTLEKTVWKAPFYCDATGDGWLGYYAGAIYRFGREAKWQYNEPDATEFADTLTMSGCNNGTLGEIRNTVFGSIELDHPVEFVCPEWAAKIPQGEDLGRSVSGFGTMWWVENSNDHDDMWDDEFARDEMVRIGVAFFDWLKKNREDGANRKLNQISLHNSKRESRRIIGDYIFTQSECDGRHFHEDDITYCGWPIDIHHPRGIYSGKEGPFHSNTYVPISNFPYRCLYSKNINNLFMAGRCVSVSHQGLGTARVESTIATMGQTVGTAVALCKKYDTLPRGIYQNHIKELQQILLRHDLTIPGIVNEDEKDLARTATVRADSVCGDAYIVKYAGTRDKFIPLDKQYYFGPAVSACAKKADHYKVELKNANDYPVELSCKLCTYNSASDINETLQCIDNVIISLPANYEGLITMPFTKDTQGKPYVINVEQKENVYIRTRFYAIGSYKTYEKTEDGIITLPDLTSFEFYYDASLEEKVNCDAKNVINGANRPTYTESNSWISDVNEGLPQSLTLTLKEPKEISEIRVTTHVDLTYPRASFGSGQTSYGIAKDFTVSVWRDGEWHVVAEVTDNIFRQVCLNFEKQLAEKVKITVTKSNNQSAAHIVEVRIYEDKTF